VTHRTESTIVRHLSPATFRSASGALLAAVSLAGPAAGQVAIKRDPSGFNLFTRAQEAEVGRTASLEIERQLPVVTSARTKRFLDAIVVQLTSRTSGDFQVRALNTAAVDALVIPGGHIYLTQGLLSLTRREAEVAGLIAHAMAHDILRHGTEQASKAYLSRAGLGALGGLTGSAQLTDRVLGITGGSGLRAAWLTFTRSDEYEADALGAEILSKAGYDPVGIATILATLRRDQGRQSDVDAFFQHHPLAPDREIRVRNLANVLRQGRSEIVGGFARLRWRVAPTAVAARPHTMASAGTVEIRTTPVPPEIPPPSTRFTRFTNAEAPVIIDHPDNWQTYQSGGAMSFAPPGGVVDLDNGARNLVQGVILNAYAPFADAVERWNRSLTHHYAPFEDRTRPRGTLEDATDDLVRQILDINAHLRAPTGSARAETVDGMRGYSVRLSGRSPITGQLERITLYTRMLPDDQVVYMACIAPGRNAVLVERTCARMAQSLRFNEAATSR
jgi:hypothetical protein